MAGLLYVEEPLVVNVQLAKLIGLNEAIVLQQVNYWVKKSTKIIEDRPWVYNSMEGWHEQFPFFHIDTVKNIFKRLAGMGLLITGNHNKNRFDRTKWYTIDYEKLDEIERQSIMENFTNAEGSDSLMEEGSAHQSDEGANHQPIPETTRDYTETSLSSELDDADTPEQVTDIELSAEEALRRDAMLLLGYLNAKTRRNYRPVDSNLRLLLARLREGATVDEIIAVIDAKHLAWAEDPVMNQYLRPATLFNATKFNQYVGELGQSTTNDDPVWTGRNTI